MTDRKRFRPNIVKFRTPRNDKVKRGRRSALGNYVRFSFPEREADQTRLPLFQYLWVLGKFLRVVYLWDQWGSQG